MIIRLHGSSFLNRATGCQNSIKDSPIAWWYGRAEMAGIRKADAVSSCSKNLAELEANFAQITPKEICIIPNAVKFKDMQFKEKLKNSKYHNYFSSSARYNIFSAGSVVLAKGYGDLANAVQILRKEGMDISLTIAGKWGTLGRRLAKKSRNDYGQWLKLLGQVSRKDLPGLYATSDLVVFPSWWEPLGIVLLEAMAARGLTIGSTAGGMKEITKEGHNGFLVEPQNPLKLAEKIKYVLLLPDIEKEKIRQQALNTVKKNYDIATVMDQQIQFYLTTIKNFKIKKGYVS